MIRCVLADDHVLFRELIVKVAEYSSIIKIIDHSSDARKAAESAVSLQADVLIMDIGMPGSDPFAAVKWAKSELPALKVIFLTGSIEDEHILAAIEAGASGYVQKGADSNNLRTAIVKVSRGEKYFPHIPKMRELSSKPTPNQLSPRQYELLKLLAEGNTVKDAAILMNLSAKTVEVHRAKLYEKLGIRNKVDLVQYAIRYKVIQAAS